MLDTSLLGKFVSLEENKGLWIWSMELNSRYLIFFVTYKLAQKAIVLVCVPDKSFQLSLMIHSSLLGKFVSNHENGVLWILPQDPIHDRCSRLED